MTDHTEKAHPKLSAKYPGGVQRGVAEQLGDSDDVGAGSVLDVFGIFAGHRDAAVRICEALVDSPDRLCAWVLANSATG